MGATKYKPYRHDAEIHKDWLVFPLAVQILSNNPWFTEKNLEISVHFLCFHIRWVFIEYKAESEDKK